VWGVGPVRTSSREHPWAELDVVGVLVGCDSKTCYSCGLCCRFRARLLQEKLFPVLQKRCTIL
jgi:hypothetical protein